MIFLLTIAVIISFCDILGANDVSPVTEDQSSENVESNATEKELYSEEIMNKEDGLDESKEITPSSNSSYSIEEVIQDEKVDEKVIEEPVQKSNNIAQARQQIELIEMRLGQKFKELGVRDRTRIRDIDVAEERISNLDKRLFISKSEAIMLRNLMNQMHETIENIIRDIEQGRGIKGDDIESYWVMYNAVSLFKLSNRA